MIGCLAEKKKKTPKKRDIAASSGAQSHHSLIPCKGAQRISIATISLSERTLQMKNIYKVDVSVNAKMWKQIKARLFSTRRSIYMYDTAFHERLGLLSKSTVMHLPWRRLMYQHLVSALGTVVTWTLVKMVYYMFYHSSSIHVSETGGQEDIWWCIACAFWHILACSRNAVPGIFYSWNKDIHPFILD